MGEIFLNKIAVLGRVVLQTASKCCKAVVCIPHFGLLIFTDGGVDVCLNLFIFTSEVP